MGLELSARTRLTRQGAAAVEGVAKVLLETDEIIVRGAIRARVARVDIRSASARNGVVTVRFRGGSLALTVGERAGQLADRFAAAPKSRLEKMGITAASSVTLVNFPDAAFAAELAALGVHVVTRHRRRATLIILGVQYARDLPRIASAARFLDDAGALWVIHPKGAVGVKDTDIFAFAKQSGLVYTKVARISDTHTAEKLVIPVERRGRRV